jgi:diguanylate cyclase (GGDEF)-like protein/PAS domain S-box-containing protein
MTDEPRSPEEILEESRELLRQANDVIYFLPDALVETELESGRVVAMNRMAELIFGYEPADIAAGLSGFALFSDEDAERVRRLVDEYVGASRARGVAYVRSGRQDLYEFEMRRKGGGVFHAETQSSFVLDARGVPVRLRSLIRDVSDRKAMERKLDELSVRDPLTGCYNRRHLERLRSHLEDPEARWGCVVLDLDDFKAVNDTHGHDEGDRVLRGFAHFVGRHHRIEDILIRLGGDEFGIVVDADSEDEILGLARRLRDAAPAHSPSAFSLGVAYRQDGEAVEEVLARADHVMYKAKARTAASMRRPEK